MKVVERTGNKLTDLLHKSNAWDDSYCKREDCVICNSTNSDSRKGLCKKRNVVYETYCITCNKLEKYEKEKFELENMKLKSGQNVSEKSENVVSGENTRNMKRKRNAKTSKVDNKKEDFKVKYIGESGRSGYERGVEHSNDFSRLEYRSHLLKHYILKHQDIKLDELEYGMRIRSTFRTALERQVGEAIAISREKRNGTELLNSKAEFNRCKIHRLDTRTDKEKLKEISAENEKENRLNSIIKEMQYKKREREKENKKRTREMKAAIMEIQNENLVKWKQAGAEQGRAQPG